MQNFSIAIHGGAGTILKSDMTAELEKAYIKALEDALQAGYAVLEQDGSAVNAVKAAIESELEDNPDAEQLLQEMAKVIQQNEPSLGMQNTNTITGDGNKVYQGNNHSQITDNSINQHHTGSGNNVAGNKIGTQTADKIYNIDRIDNAKF